MEYMGHQRRDVKGCVNTLKEGVSVLNPSRIMP